jgi:hypothetical protein
LLLGAPIRSSAVLAIAWSLFLALVGYLLAHMVYYRGPAR